MKNMIWIGLGVLAVVIVIGALAVYLGVIRSIENYYFGADKDILEFGEVTNFVATAKGQGADRVLEISGLSMNSSLVVNKLYTSQEGSVLNIRISQILARENMSGSFDYEIPIPEGSVSAVTFGNNKAQIWIDDKAKGGGLMEDPLADQSAIVNKICGSNQGYVVDVYTNDEGVIGGYVARHTYAAGASTYYYNADGSEFASASGVEELNNKELATKISTWSTELRTNFPHEETIECFDSADTAKGGGLTGEPGDQNAEPIGSIEMDMEGNLIFFFNGSEREVTNLAPSHPDYQKWIVHVGGIRVGEKKPIPPLAR